MNPEEELAKLLAVLAESQRIAEATRKNLAEARGILFGLEEKEQSVDAMADERKRVAVQEASGQSD